MTASANVIAILPVHVCHAVKEMNGEVQVAVWPTASLPTVPNEPLRQETY